MGFFVPTVTRQNPLTSKPGRQSRRFNMYQAPSGYIFRMRVPNDLRQIVGKTEFRYSLRTGSLRVAKPRACSIASFIKELFMRLRSDMPELTQEQINTIVQQYIRETLSNDERCRAIGQAYTPGQTTLEGKTFRLVRRICG